MCNFRWGVSAIILFILSACAQTELVSPTKSQVSTETVTLTATPAPSITSQLISPSPTLPATSISTDFQHLDIGPYDGEILFSIYPYGDIALMSIDGSNRRLLIDQPGGSSIYDDRHAVWLPDGNRISYTIDNFYQADIWIMNTQGEDQQMVLEGAVTNSSHSWSPDGKKVGFVSLHHKIMLFDLDSQITTPLTNGDFRLEADPEWSPDGTQLAFSAVVSGGNQDIYIINSDGTGLTRITNHPELDQHPDWSPDGTKIVFSSKRGGNQIKNIYLIDLNQGSEEDGNHPTQLTFGDTLDIDPDWSPDSSLIVFSAHTPGTAHATLFILDPNGKGIYQLTEENTYYSPQWKP